MNTSERLSYNSGDELDVAIWWEVPVEGGHAVHYEVNPVTVDINCYVCSSLSEA